jgi:hypothetical protein
LIRAPLSTTSVLDEMSDAVALAAAPWAGVLVLTSLPYYFLQVLFLDRLAEVGHAAAHYGHALGAIANWTILAFIVCLWGRAVWARACRIALETGARPGLSVLRVPLAALASYVLTASMAEVLFYGTLLSFVGPLVVILFGGIAIGTMELNEEVGVAGPLRFIGRYSRHVRVELAILFIFIVGWVIALVNINAAFGIAVWAAHGFAGTDISRWQVLLDMHNRTYRLLLFAGAALAVEPFWIAANVVLVRKAGAAESGEELRIWFRELQGRSE